MPWRFTYTCNKVKNTKEKEKSILINTKHTQYHICI